MRRDGLGTRAAPRRGRRALLIVGAALAVALMVASASAWYYSDQLHDALVVTSAQQSAYLRISPAGPGRLVIKADGQALWLRPLLSQGRTWGITWRDGYGQIHGRPLSSTRTSATVAFRLLDGPAPIAHTAAALDRAAYPPAAAATFKEVADVRVRGELSALPAYVARGSDDGHDWAVLVHGLGDRRQDMFRLMRSTVSAGYTSLDISYRNDAGTTSDPTGIAQLGRTEWVDLAAAVRYAQARGAKRVVLCGASMGGAIIASYLRHRAAGDAAAQGPPVSGLILDAPMLDFNTVVDYESSQYPLPVVDTPPPAGMVWAAKLLATARFGIDWSATDNVHGRSWATVPTLLFQGLQDSTVPPTTATSFAAAHSSTVHLVLSPGSEHEEAWNADPDSYDKTAQAFLAELRRPS